MAENLAKTEQSTSDVTRPLAGVRVLDFGHTLMGPCAGLLLADLGADVIKIEPLGGDPTRRLPGFAAGFFASFNRNKRSIALDLKSDRGREVLHRLVRHADVVLENYAPGTISRLGGDWETLSAINPRLIYLSLKGFLKGPSDGRGALDEVIQMETGIAYMTGPPGRPLRAGASIIDILGAVFGVAGVLSALFERTVTGRGKRIGASLFESAAFLVGPHIAGGVVSGKPMVPFPARENAFSIYDVFDTIDGSQVFVGITSDAHWLRFCEEFDRADLVEDTRLATNTSRCAERGWLIPTIAEMLGQLSAATILEACNRARIPASPIRHPDDLLNDPQMLAGGLLGVAIGAMGGGQIVDLPGLPLEFGPERARASLRMQPPCVSQHGRQILAENGYCEAEAEELIRAGIVAEGADDSIPKGDEHQS